MSDKWEMTHKADNNVAKVEFISIDKEIIVAMRNLSKQALRAGGKVIAEKLRQNDDLSENMKNHITVSADIDRKSGAPQLKIGFAGWRRVAEKKHKTPSKRNPWWQEIGTKPHQIARKDGGKILGSNGFFFSKSVHNPGFPAMHTLKNTVFDNVNEIQAEIKNHLAELNGLIDAALMKEDYNEDIDE